MINVRVDELSAGDRFVYDGIQYNVISNEFQGSFNPRKVMVRMEGTQLTHEMVASTIVSKL